MFFHTVEHFNNNIDDNFVSEYKNAHYRQSERELCVWCCAAAITHHMLH